MANRRKTPYRRNTYDFYYSDYPPSRPIETQDGLKARSQRGEFVKNWWAQRWIEALEKLMDPGRLSRGRRYARQGQVLSIDEKGKGVEALVQGSNPAPYKVKIQLRHLNDAQWEQVIDAMAEQALFTAQLLAGEMPQNIEQAFQAAGVNLFPVKENDLISDCSCPDWANPCKHIAATHYILGERFDEDPFLLFRLRGRSQAQVLQGLRQRRAGQDELETSEDEPERIVPLEETLEHFWENAAPLEAFSVSIRPPAIEMTLLKRLGDPNFVPEPGLQAILLPAFRRISQAALTAAFEESGQEPADLE